MTTGTGATCCGCGKSSALTSSTLSVCVDCIRNHFDSVESSVRQAHSVSRSAFGLPARPPRAEGGVACPLCVNQCRIGDGERGFCGLRQNRQGRLVHLAGTKRGALVSWYHDPLPTNCVADWVCPGGSRAGYPDYSFKHGPEYGYENLAVFYQACTFNCLFCQNWHYRESRPEHGLKGPEELVDAVRDTTACICYFGGDPTPQVHHALEVSRRSIKKTRGRILRICWETNGSMPRKMLRAMAELALQSGGCIKFDLKAFDENLHRALCGVSNRQTLDNFRWLADYAQQRPDPPLLIASTLLVPGYVDREEVSKIARFMASLDKSLPYSLLAFYPCFFMHDLPRTSRRHADQAFDAAVAAGLRRVRIGNRHLLSNQY